MRVLVALGGNAMTGPDGSATPEAQRAAIAEASRAPSPTSSRPGTRWSSPTATARRSATCWSRTSSPPPSCRPCRWTGAAPRPRRRSASPLLDALEAALAARGAAPPGRRPRLAHARRRRRPRLRPPDQADRPLPAAEQAQALIDHGQHWEDRGEKGWRRVVASPEPLEVPRRRARRSTLLVARATSSSPPAVAASPSCATPDGVAPRRRGRHRQGPHRRAARARRSTPTCWSSPPTSTHAVADWGTPDAHASAGVTLAEMQRMPPTASFASGSMGPKVEAALPVRPRVAADAASSPRSTSIADGRSSGQARHRRRD